MALYSTPEEVEKLLDHMEGEQLEHFKTLCSNLPCPKEYITKYAENYGWPENILKRARLFTPSVLPRPIPYYRPNWRCYETSFAYAEKYGLKYIEGLAIYAGGAMVHAWCSTDGKDVIDYTWPYQHLNKYFGVEFDRAWLKEQGYPNGGILGFLEEKVKKKKTVAA